MMNIFLLFFFLYTISFALEVNLKGAITDIAIGKSKIAVSTEKGKVFILKKENLSVEQEISLPELTDFMGEKQKAKVFSVDLSPSEKKVLIVVESDLGKRTIFLFEKGALKPILKLTDASKGMFLDEDNIILGTIANEIWLYNIKDRKTVYKYLVFRFVFSDFDMNRDKNLIAWGDESGKVFFIDPKNGKVIGVGTEGNKDKIFKLSFAKNRVIVGGRDKKSTIFNLKNKITDRKEWKEKLDAPSLLKNVKSQFINRELKFVLFPEKIYESKFMVFAVAISPNEKYAVFTSDEEGHLTVVAPGIGIKKVLDVGCFVNALEFIDDKRLLVGCIDGILKVMEVR
ncbi:MAG TPA: hypothetical protein EYG91_06240 [Aquifex aeolicus]|nr:hypothetical protein [Aquifex aeolicus]